uniref:Tumor necrosis factor receptor superfamily, member 1a n=1 Tax=Xiphophorus couchianus TaxID=32473 RepID=A0A3B5MMZ9_9TELE
ISGVLTAEKQCEPWYYETDGICCNKCHAGFKLVEKCTSNQISRCTPCGDGEFSDQINFSSTCRRCKRCKGKNEEQVSPCQRHSNTKCQCKKGYYKHNIDSETYDCVECKKCGPNETLIHPLSLLLHLLIQLIKKQKGKKKPNRADSLSFPPCSAVTDFIYSVLDLVPLQQMKQLVRSLGVTDTEIEQAEMDNRYCREAHYQMLRVWAQRAPRTVGGGKSETVHRQVLEELLSKLRQLHLSRAAEELETKYAIQGNTTVT